MKRSLLSVMTALVGNSKAAGTLFLAINDDVYGRYGAGYHDNQGSLRVSITSAATEMDAMSPADAVLFIQSVQMQVYMENAAALANQLNQLNENVQRSRERLLKEGLK